MPAMWSEIAALVIVALPILILILWNRFGQKRSTGNADADERQSGAGESQTKA